MIDVQLVQDIINAAGLIVFFMLSGAVLFSLVRRYLLYHIAQMPTPVMLRRNLALFGAIVIAGGVGITVRWLGIDFTQHPPERLAYSIFIDFILIGSLAYYAKVELSDIDDPNEP